MTTTRNPVSDRMPATGALCVSSLRCEDACRASAAADSTDPANAIGSAMPAAERRT